MTDAFQMTLGHIIKINFLFVYISTLKQACQCLPQNFPLKKQQLSVTMLELCPAGADWGENLQWIQLITSN